MSGEIKSGKEVVDDFIGTMKSIPGVDDKTVEVLLVLYKDGKFTDKNISNALLDARVKGEKC
jgi:hypothetical protein